jgi:SAM-dependent methyltransferase
MIDMESIHQHYEKFAAGHGLTPRASAWGTDEQRNRRRYQAMVRNIAFEEGPVSILDVGSGHGEIINYLPPTEFEYTGIDIVEASVAKGRAACGGRHEFICGDFMEHEFGRSFDYVLVNGAFNYKSDNSILEMDRLLYAAIFKMFSLCRRKLIINLISNKVNFFSEAMYYKSPVEMLSWCLDNLTTKVDLDHSSVSYEYIITLGK